MMPDSVVAARHGVNPHPGDLTMKRIGNLAKRYIFPIWYGSPGLPASPENHENNPIQITEDPAVLLQDRISTY